MPITTYCTWASVIKRISADAADLRTDDDPTSQDDILESAAVEVNGYLQLNYSVATLAQSDWVGHKARDIAVMLLCERRNHPAPQSVVRAYEKAIRDLERIQAGAMRLPDVPEDKANVPVLSNQRVALQPVPRVVTVLQKSTGTAEDYLRFTDNQDALDYSI